MKDIRILFLIPIILLNQSHTKTKTQMCYLRIRTNLSEHVGKSPNYFLHTWKSISIFWFFFAHLLCELHKLKHYLLFPFKILFATIEVFVAPPIRCAPLLYVHQQEMFYNCSFFGKTFNSTLCPFYM